MKKSATDASLDTQSSLNSSETQLNISQQLKNSVQDDYPIIVIEPNKKQDLRLRFVHNPEYIQIGQRIIINDNLLKAIGVIKEIYY